jgi:glycosyltransferase involved in cell wall biosynthesis
MATTQKVVLLSGNHLCNNPRVIKEANALAGRGFAVTVLAACLNADLKDRDIEIAAGARWLYASVLDLAERKRNGRSLYRRATGKGARVLYRSTGMATRPLLGYAPGELLNEAMKLDADLYIAHSEQALWVASRLLRKGRKVGVDMEDWFSEDLLPEARKTRPISVLRKLEQLLLTKGQHRTCTSNTMSRALAEAYQCEPPTVVYNAFPLSDRSRIDRSRRDKRDCTLPSVHWFSQTLGPGRGLEDLFAALPLLQYPVEIHLRGNPAQGCEEWISRSVAPHWRARVLTHFPVHNDELLSYVAGHDIGFAGEMKYSKSRDLTATNKVFYYMLAGLAVIASDTEGQQEIMQSADGAGFTYKSGDPLALAALLNTLLANPELIDRAKAASWKAADTFCWERQERVFIDSVISALRRGSSFPETRNASQSTIDSATRHI